ncbi:MAG: RHS repeat-associated core domain-containing protein, partial [Bryobacterales bacterium]|nr:RHS repeat-associated core domain-containing protein [Bryobacterales bacterium]
NSAVFIRTDTGLQGTWKGFRGGDGYNVIGDTTAYPAYVTVTPSGQSNYTWASATTDVRALQTASSGTRIAATWYTSGSYTVDMDFTDGLTHRVAVYCVDWDSPGGGRTQTLSILDGDTGSVLDSRNLAGFQNGVWEVWSLSGHVKLQVTNTNSSENAVISGLMFDPGAPAVSYTYDSMGRLSSLSDTWTSVIASASYGAGGQLLSLSGGSWGTETRTYNSLQQLTQLTSPVWNMQYNFSPSQNSGKILSQSVLISGEQISYTYDSLNRLASAASNQNWSQTFSYDGFGKLTNVTGVNAPGLGVTYNPATNQQTTDCADLNGNVMGNASCAGANAYGYDVENRVSAVPGGMQYGYSPSNQRVWRGNGSSVDEIAFWGPAGQKLATYQISSGVAVLTSANYYFGSKLIKNAPGMAYTDRLGSTVKTYPYGQERPSATANGKEKFAGYLRDPETGNDYAVNRYEQPGMGRFLSADPKPNTGASNPTTWNRYSYAGGDPINNTDPSGLDWIWAGSGWCSTLDFYGGCYDPGMSGSCGYYAQLAWMNPVGYEQECGGTGLWGVVFFAPPGGGGGGGGGAGGGGGSGSGGVQYSCDQLLAMWTDRYLSNYNGWTGKSPLLTGLSGDAGTYLVGLSESSGVDLAFILGIGRAESSLGTAPSINGGEYNVYGNSLHFTTCRPKTRDCSKPPYTSYTAATSDAFSTIGGYLQPGTTLSTAKAYGTYEGGETGWEKKLGFLNQTDAALTGNLGNIRFSCDTTRADQLRLALMTSGGF